MRKSGSLSAAMAVVLVPMLLVVLCGPVVGGAQVCSKDSSALAVTLSADEGAPSSSENGLDAAAPVASARSDANAAGGGL